MKKRYAAGQLIVYLLVIGLMLVGCTNHTATKPTNKGVLSKQVEAVDPKVISAADKNAKAMLEKYRLHPVQRVRIFGPKETQRLLYDNKWTPELFSTASKHIGLDLNKGREKNVVILSYRLKEQCQSHERTVTASFVLDNNGSLIGAFMSLSGYMPGVVGLDERYALLPEGLSRDKLSFEGLSKIEIAGWRAAEKGWEDSATVSNPEDIEHITSLIEQSIGHRGTYDVAGMGEEEYRMLLYYKDGPIIDIWLAPKNNRDQMGIDAFDRWHYYPPKELRTEIKRLLSTNTPPR
ncbi:MAG TPA: hypothetical protein VGK02_03160 [Candidatus Aquicultor sp.]